MITTIPSDCRIRRVLCASTAFTSFISIKHRRERILSLGRFSWCIWHFRIQLVILKLVAGWQTCLVWVDRSLIMYIAVPFLFLLFFLRRFQNQYNNSKQGRRKPDRTWQLKAVSSWAGSQSLEGFVGSESKPLPRIGIRKEDLLEKVAVSLSLKAQCTLGAAIPQN